MLAVPGRGTERRGKEESAPTLHPSYTYQSLQPLPTRIIGASGKTNIPTKAQSRKAQGLLWAPQSEAGTGRTSHRDHTTSLPPCRVAQTGAEVGKQQPCPLVLPLPQEGKTFTGTCGHWEERVAVWVPPWLRLALPSPPQCLRPTFLNRAEPWPLWNKCSRSGAHAGGRGAHPTVCGTVSYEQQIFGGWVPDATVSSGLGAAIGACGHCIE